MTIPRLFVTTSGIPVGWMMNCTSRAFHLGICERESPTRARNAGDGIRSTADRERSSKSVSLSWRRSQLQLTSGWVKVAANEMV